jgi:dTDP-4-amino-4,6-dideoxygalactose transaminase|tara:strand:+ start:5372 stop:6529 length:1158 start_codon:yes stop_codon:yes gene_type:complete
MNKFIPYSRHYITQKDINIVKKSLQSDYLTNGYYLELFEKKIKNFTGSKYSVACSNGTAGIFMAYKALNLNKNSIIIIPAINFLAAFNMAAFLNSKIYIADIDSETGQMTPENVVDCLKKNNLKKVDLVVTMYNGGCPLNAEGFFKLKKKYKFQLMEDACHALGAKYTHTQKHKIGSCRYADICVFSLHPQKTISSGEGGIVTTNNEKIYKRLKKFRNHGMERNISTKKKFHWKYSIKEPSFNFRLSEINCALACSQLNKISFLLKERKKIAEIYIKLFKENKNLVIPNHYFKYNSAWHLFFIHIKKTSKISRDKLIQKLYKNNILTQVHYIPIFLQPKYRYLKRKFNFLGSKKFYSETISLPIFPNLSLKKVKLIAKIVNKHTN